MLKAAHSRVPVYDGERNVILGVILVKRLIGLDLEEAVSLRELIKDGRCFYNVTYTMDTTPLYDLLNEFQKGRSEYGTILQM